MEVDQVRTSDIENYLGAAFALPQGAQRQFWKRVIDYLLVSRPLLEDLSLEYSYHGPWAQPHMGLI
eukprot:5829363-Pyramimonas_sp.AAC.1